MNEPVIRHFDKVENLHIGDVYSSEESAKEKSPEYKVKYIINIEKENSKEEPKAPSKTPRASETYSPEELAEYQACLVDIRNNEPKIHKAKWW